MVALQLDLMLFLNIFYVSDCVRRIKGGAVVSADKRYVVYLVKAPNSDKVYDSWLCGGALVSTLFIVTSAACVDDVEYLYAIAGYKKYITDENIDTDACTKEKKKKVVYTCVPMKYELDYHKLEKWSFIDIALAKVESAYDFADSSFKTSCSYIPDVIPINYEPRFQKPGTDALVYGWGHTEIWRATNDFANYNQPTMRFARTKVIDKPTCKKHYEVYPNMSEVIDQFMICTLTQGEINDKGEHVPIEVIPKVNGCKVESSAEGNMTLLSKVGCIVDGDYNNYGDALLDVTRRKVTNANKTSNITLFPNKTRDIFNKPANNSRKHGICQNDHGGPLVSWIGGHEVLIGVASVFKVSDDHKCMGPYLFTSTQCNGAFLDCVLSNSGLPDQEGRRAICDSPPIQRGYDTVERYISWRHHPAGPADNERAFGYVKYVGTNEKKAKAKTLQNLVKLAILSTLAKNQTSVQPQQQLLDEEIFRIG